MRIKSLIAAFGLLFMVAAAVLVPTPAVLAANSNTNLADQAADGVNAIGGGGETVRGESLTNIVQNLINITLFIVGILAVVFIIVGGIRYQTSGGDPAKVKAAQQTLTYAIVGLIVAILAFAIVNFVIGQLN